MNRPIKRTPSSGDRAARSFGTSYRSQHGEQSIASIAEESIARDLEDVEPGGQSEEPNAENALGRSLSHDWGHFGQYAMVGNHRRPSVLASGPRGLLGTQQPETIISLEQDYEEALNEERSLLRDNNLLPPKHPRRQSSTSIQGLMRRVSRASFKRTQSLTVDEEADTGHGRPVEPEETTALLGHHLGTGRDPEAPYGGEDSRENIDKKWEEAVRMGKIQTTWQRECKVLAKYSAPLSIAFILQNSLTLTSVFTVGHIGKIELGAVSLGGMTASITGYAVYHGLATSLDTLCAQAYGSGRKKLVGLQLQRMVFFLWLITIPIAIIWLAGTQILSAIIPEKQIAIYAGRYLKVLILGAPGYAAFESGKRYVQAQGRFAATLYVLLIAAPLNVLMHWLFVWKFQWGFIGCPIAVVITENLMPLLLFLYIRFVGGMECWPGFTKNAFKNWGPMIRLALPGLIMVMAEFLAFEILTLASARLSATHLAAQTVLQSLSVLAYMLPFPVAIAASTRVANLVGATLPEAAKVSARVAVVAGFIIGSINMILLGSLRNQIPWLFTNEEDVALLAARTLPINAAVQLSDALAAVMNGILRGIGKQEMGGYVSLFAYYACAMPISFGLCFGLHLDLYGLWTGPAIALAIVWITEGLYIWRTNWQKAAEEAAKRNAAG